MNTKSVINIIFLLPQTMGRALATCRYPVLVVEAFSSLKLSHQFTITSKLLTTPSYTKPLRMTCIYFSNRKVAMVPVVIITTIIFSIQQVKVAVLVGIILPLM